MGPSRFAAFDRAECRFGPEVSFARFALQVHSKLRPYLSTRGVNQPGVTGRENRLHGASQADHSDQTGRLEVPNVSKSQSRPIWRQVLRVTSSVAGLFAAGSCDCLVAANLAFRESDSMAFGVDVENFDSDDIAHADFFRGICDVAVCQFGNVDQPILSIGSVEFESESSDA